MPHLIQDSLSYDTGSLIMINPISTIVSACYEYASADVSCVEF